MSKLVTGLDIGTGSIKMVQIRRISSGLEIVKAVSKEMSYNKDEKKYPDKEVVKDTIRNLLKDNNVRPGPVVSSIPRYLAAVKYITLPSKDRKEIKEMLKYEAEKQMPFSVDKAELDFQILDEAAGSESSVLLAAVKKDIVEEHLKLLKECGLKPDCIDISSFAILNAVSNTNHLKEKSVIALIDIGSGMLEINIVKEGILRFTRSASVSCDDLTLMMQKELNVDSSVAERLKKEYGLIAPESGELAESPIAKVTKQWVSSLIYELRRSLDAYKVEQYGGRVEKLLLTGGGAGLKGLVEILRDRLGIEVKVVNPLANISVGTSVSITSDTAPVFTSAIGLALRGNIKNNIEINLVPAWVEEAERLKMKRYIRLVIISLVAITIAGVIIVLTDKAKENWAQISILDKRLDDLSLVHSRVELVKKQKDIIEEYQWEGATILEVLSALSKFSPPDIYFTNIKFKKNEWLDLTGKAGSRSSISNMVNILQRMGYFDKVELKYTEGSGESIEFGIYCQNKRKEHE